MVNSYNVIYRIYIYIYKEPTKRGSNYYTLMNIVPIGDLFWDLLNY